MLKMQLRSLFSWLWRENIPGGSDLVRTCQAFLERRDLKQQLLSPAGLEVAVRMGTAYVEGKPHWLRASVLQLQVTEFRQQPDELRRGHQVPQESTVQVTTSLLPARPWKEDSAKVCPDSTHRYCEIIKYVFDTDKFGNLLRSIEN